MRRQWDDEGTEEVVEVHPSPESQVVYRKRSSPLRAVRPTPYRWSQRWFDDPPVGTINFDGGRNPEIYLGNGEWQPL